MKKHGLGAGCIWYGIGSTGRANPAGAFVELLKDGTAIVLTGAADIGQGSSTVLAQIAAEELGLKVTDVRMVTADTGVTPDAGATSGSRQTYISGNAVLRAARSVREILLAEAERLLRVSTGRMRFYKCGLYVDDEPEPRLSLVEIIQSCRSQGVMTLGHGWFNPRTVEPDPVTGQGEFYASYAYATYAYATQIVEVEVDTETGEVAVLKVVAAHDVGRAINPRQVEAQIEGGCIMGLGNGILEEVILQNGRILTPNLHEYLIPTVMDIPEVYPVILEETEPTGPWGAKGVGEPALIPTAAAIANAVYDAIGVRICELPLTPEKVLAALKN